MKELVRVVFRSPFWGRVLYSPGVGLEENPIYLRLSARAFGRGSGGWRGLFWLPPEMSRSAGRLLGQIGLLPYILLLAPYVCLLDDSRFMAGYGFYGVSAVRGLTDIAYVFGALLLYARAVEGESSALVRNFLRNGAAGAWGEALYLTSLAPADYERGLFAGILQREARSLLLRLAFLTAAIAPVTLLWSLAFRVYNPFHPLMPAVPSFASAGRMIRFAALVGGACYLEFIMISSVNLAAMLRGAARRGRAARLMDTAWNGARLGGLRLPQFAFITCVHVTAHLSGAAAYLLWTMNSIHRARVVESSAFGLSDLRGLYIFVLANIPATWLLVRVLLRRHQGAVGRELAAAIRGAD